MTYGYPFLATFDFVGKVITKRTNPYNKEMIDIYAVCATNFERVTGTLKCK